MHGKTTLPFCPISPCLGHLPSSWLAEPRAHLAGSQLKHWAPQWTGKMIPDASPPNAADSNMEASKNTATPIPRVMYQVGGTEPHLIHSRLPTSNVVAAISAPESCVRISLTALSKVRQQGSEGARAELWESARPGLGERLTRVTATSPVDP